MRRRILALGGVAMLAVAACSSGTHHAAPTTTSPAPSTAAAPNPDVIPPVITVAYVNAVLAVLNHVYGDATRELRKSHSVTAAARADLRAIFNDPLFSQQLQAANLSLGGAIDNVRPDAGDGTTVVKSLMTASAGCIFVQTTTNLSAVLIRPTPSAASEYYELAPKQTSIDPDQLNATPWAFAFNVAYLTPTAIQSRCVG